jgi:hypothetical protein
MNDSHWQTIEDALLARRQQCGRYIYDARGFAWTLDADRVVNIDAAFAFVREQREKGEWEPLPDDTEIQDTERNTWLSVERGGALISMSQHDTEDDPIAHDLFEVGLPPSVRLCRKQGGDA